MAKDVRLKRLQKNCEITLQRYTSTASDTCSLIGKLRHLPVSKDKRLEIFLQRKKEEEALNGYLKARQELLSTIEESPELLNAEQPDERRPPRTFGTPRSGNFRRRAG